MPPVRTRGFLAGVTLADRVTIVSETEAAR